MEVTVNVSLNGLEEKLHQLGPKLAKKALKKALAAGAKIIEDEAKAKAPVDTGDLRDSITTVIKLNGKQDRGTATIGPSFDIGTKKKPNTGDQSQSPGVYGMIVELGNKRQSAQPFLRPAIDGKAQAVIDAFTTELREGLEEVAKA